MKRLRFLSTIISATTFLTMVMLISPFFVQSGGKPSEIKDEWLSLTMIEKTVEKYEANYDGTIYIIRDDEQIPQDKYCFFDGEWHHYLQRTHIFRAGSDDGKLTFWFAYDYPDPVMTECDPFQVFGTQSIFNSLLLDGKYLLENEQRERCTTGGPSTPNEKAIEYIDLLKKTVDNWRQEWPLSPASE